MSSIKTLVSLQTFIFDKKDKSQTQFLFRVKKSLLFILYLLTKIRKVIVVMEVAQMKTNYGKLSEVKNVSNMHCKEQNPT